MSWVTDVLLLFSLSELYDDDEEELTEILPLSNINAWLKEHGYGILDDLTQHLHNSGKAMQTYLYGGAFNYLKIEEFVAVVKAQVWREPQNVQLLIKREEDERFTVYTLS